MGQHIANPWMETEYASSKMPFTHTCVMEDGIRWEEISSLGYPESSVSAQLRHLRKPKFGGHTILKRRRFSGHGLWEYQLHLAHTFIDDKCYCGARNPEPVQLKLLKWEG